MKSDNISLSYTAHDGIGNQFSEKVYIEKVDSSFCVYLEHCHENLSSPIKLGSSLTPIDWRKLRTILQNITEGRLDSTFINKVKISGTSNLRAEILAYSWCDDCPNFISELCDLKEHEIDIIEMFVSHNIGSLLKAENLEKLESLMDDIETLLEFDFIDSIQKYSYNELLNLLEDELIAQKIEAKKQLKERHNQIEPFRERINTICSSFPKNYSFPPKKPVQRVVEYLIIEHLITHNEFPKKIIGTSKISPGYGKGPIYRINFEIEIHDDNAECVSFSALRTSVDG